MTATNHVITGSLIAVAVKEPALALPLAFLAHFALDALPHFGNHSAAYAKRMRITKRILPVDMLVALIILITIAVARPAHWPVIVLGGILCASPDLMWMPGFFRALHGETKRRPMNWVMKFHSFIQWGERPWGMWVEAMWFVAIGFSLAVTL